MRRVTLGTTLLGLHCTRREESTAPPPPSSSSSSPPPEKEDSFFFRARWNYCTLFRSKTLTDFFWCDKNRVVAIAHTYQHIERDITVTLIPIRHMAHPLFFKQVDELCCQHDSVLMEGRVPLLNAPYSTFVHPREKLEKIRPDDHEDDEGWEPREVERFFQPFSWGVAASPNHTVVHAADKYDYEKLPLWASVRFNTPLLGSLAREKHCLNMIYPLRRNGYKSFAIPWGAFHMPLFHEMLVDNDFELTSMCSLLVLQRIDGTVSEGECQQVWRAQRRRRSRIYILYGVGGLLLGWGFVSSVRVQYNRDIKEINS
ncbi:hypothetical protein AGDE_14842 [Angomonas deanei]|uniref:Uncharacterized protein n=1 Tax=Angomonas deanei TaxID=59799 RepID=A0A7G2CTH2_9TRYP|nr:hypothetical protein AGDE_14842 [Angomonas deanei]CAD2222351.1 hypothetical protein, conserved [Angomonas deanei]|eukprot:EPY20131.1 hypothetical protein AGDE_14842 [Angomonas deanei]